MSAEFLCPVSTGVTLWSMLSEDISFCNLSLELDSLTCCVY